MEQEQCLYPGCETKRKTRGLCGLHYTYAYRLVKRKHTTWEQLEAENKVLPTSGVTAKVHKWFLEGTLDDVDIKE